MDENPTLLLIIDDEQSVCRSLRRILRSRVVDIVTVSTMTDARLVLDTRPVTHILCDHLLGPGQPRGIDEAKKWKQRYPSIRRITILTGSTAIFDETPDGIDVVLPKTTDPLQLADLIGV